MMAPATSSPSMARNHSDAVEVVVVLDRSASPTRRAASAPIASDPGTLPPGPPRTRASSRPRSNPCDRDALRPDRFGRRRVHVDPHPDEAARPRVARGPPRTALRASRSTRRGTPRPGRRCPCSRGDLDRAPLREVRQPGADPSPEELRDACSRRSTGRPRPLSSSTMTEPTSRPSAASTTHASRSRSNVDFRHDAQQLLACRRRARRSRRSSHAFIRSTIASTSSSRGGGR